ncbi:MAG: hypothetical protein ABI862_13935 [Ilumatobacteraceae bacterium]
MEALFVLAIYMVPTIVALSRDTPYKGSTIAVNILASVATAVGSPKRFASAAATTRWVEAHELSFPLLHASQVLATR